MEISRETWEAKGHELFGPDQDNWAFVCPICGHEMSIAKARAEFAEHLPKLREGRYAIVQECIGRHVAGVGCDWASYGLFRGPLIVDGTTAFDFAGKPFTASKGGEDARRVEARR